MMYELNIRVVFAYNTICNQVADCLVGYDACTEGVEACMYCILINDRALDLATCLEPMFTESRCFRDKKK